MPFKEFFERKAFWKCLFMPLFFHPPGRPTISDVYLGMQGSTWGLGKTAYHRYIRMKVYFLRLGVRNRSTNDGLSFSAKSSSRDSI